MSSSSSSSSRASRPAHDIVVRIKCSTGRIRLNIRDDEKLPTLKQKVAEATNVPVEEVILCNEDGTPLEGNHRSLARLRIKTGDLIELRSKTKPSVSAAYTAPPKHVTSADLSPEQPPRPLPPTEPTQASASSSDNSSSTSHSSSPNPTNNTSAPVPHRDSSTSSGAKGEDGGPKRPAFCSFDKFLKDRGYLTSDLPLALSYKPLPLQMGRMTKLPPSVTLKHQPYRHVDHLEFMNISEVSEFVRYWRDDLGMSNQRLGWMYGYYREDQHYEMGIRAVVEGIYEPPQLSECDTCRLIDDPFKLSVDKVAAGLGFECLGLIFTTLPKDQSLTSEESLAIARLQLKGLNHSHYTGYPLTKSVVCTISPCADVGGEPVPNAYMISDMGMAFIRDDILADSDDPTHFQLKTPAKNELYPQILESGHPTQKFDVDWFVVRVNNSAPKKVRSRFCFSRFPRENRSSQQIPPSAIGTHLREVASKVKPASGSSTASASWQKFADFHLLLYIAKLLGIENSLSICGSIVGESAVDPQFEDSLLQLQA